LPKPDTISLDQRRTQREQQAELEQATKQLMESLVRTFKAQRAIDQTKD
jgi:hypothetical protein